MTYKQAIEKALTVRWKTVSCSQGAKCWCRGIRPEKKIKDSEGNEVYIVSTGSMNKEFARYIVKLHNDSL